MFSCLINVCKNYFYKMNEKLENMTLWKYLNLMSLRGNLYYWFMLLLAVSWRYIWLHLGLISIPFTHHNTSIYIFFALILISVKHYITYMLPNNLNHLTVSSSFAKLECTHFFAQKKIRCAKFCAKWSNKPRFCVKQSNVSIFCKI